MPVKLNHASAALRVCVDQCGDGRAAGAVYSQRLRIPMPFTDVGGLLLQVDAVLDAQNFPQAFQRVRTFRAGEKRPLSPYAAASLEEGMAAETVAAASGKRATFVVYVITRRSTTWQGRVDWLDGGDPVPFSSALEFVKLVDERLSAL